MDIISFYDVVKLERLVCWWKNGVGSCSCKGVSIKSYGVLGTSCLFYKARLFGTIAVCDPLAVFNHFVGAGVCS